MYDCHYISSSFSSRITICDTLVNQEYKDISWSISMQKAGNGLNAVFLTCATNQSRYYHFTIHKCCIIVAKISIICNHPFDYGHGLTISNEVKLRSMFYSKNGYLAVISKVHEKGSVEDNDKWINRMIKPITWY